MKTNNPSEHKAPKTVLVRELIPWMLVTVFVFSTIGLVAGWFFHANVAVEKTQAVAAVVSKAERR
jgi:hypothetical protein